MNDCFSAPRLMPLAVAKTNLLAKVNAITDIETIPLSLIDNRVSAENIYSPLNVPAHNNSAMDGYAFKIENDENPENINYVCVGTAMAGAPFLEELQAGQCIRIMTGAVVPDSANAVEMQENVVVNNSIISLEHTLKIGNHIRLAGEDIARNERVFDKGHKFNAVDIGLLASLGIENVSVLRKPKVAVFSTGDELKSPGQALALGDIYESNSQVIKAMLARMNVDIIDLGIIEDDPKKIKSAFKTADLQADAVISSGGVSVGDADYTKDVLDSLGNIEFWKVAMKPGKPFAFGLLDNSLFFGLPGNPVSAAVTFHKLTVPALQKMSGMEVKENMKLQAVTTKKVSKRPGRKDFQRGNAAINNQGQLEVTPLSHQGSGVLSSLSKANCYLILEQEENGNEVGDIVTIEMFDHILA